METHTNYDPIKAIVTKRLSQGETLTSLAKKLGYTSPSILSMILNNKRRPSSLFTLRMCRFLDLNAQEKRSLMESHSLTKESLHFLDPPFSGVERKELFKYLNGKDIKDIHNRPAFKKIRNEFSDKSKCLFQDKLNFPYYFQASIPESQMREFERDLSSLIEDLTLKYFKRESSESRKLIECLIHLNAQLH